jgi:hypothetical protein
MMCFFLQTYAFFVETNNIKSHSQHKSSKFAFGSSRIADTQNDKELANLKVFLTLVAHLKN